MAEIGDQEVFHARQRAGSGHGIDTDQDGQNDQNRHHDARDALDSVLDAHENDDQDQSYKDDKPEFSLKTVADKASEIAVIRDSLDIAAKIFKKIFADPSSDD